jgi:FkbM family methyltransferase
VISFIREFLRRCAWAVGYELRRRMDVVDFLASRRIDLVLDVGANTGQFAQRLRARGYDKDIISFEPASEPFAELAKAASGDPHWEACNVALGSTPGEATIKIAENSVYNSFRDRTPVAGAFDTKSATVKTESVEVTTLDAVLEGKQNRRVFLKMDTQGFEREILAGASKSLLFILGILLEVPIVHLYEGTWGLADVLVQLKEMGFVLAQVSPINYLRELDPASLAEVDCVFRRADARLDVVAATVGLKAAE